MEVSRITKTRLKNKDYIQLYGYQEDGTPKSILKEYDNFVWMKLLNISRLKLKHLVLYDKEYKAYNSSDTFKKVILKNNNYYISKPVHDLSYNDDISVLTKYVLLNDVNFSRKRHIAFFDIETYYNEDNPIDNTPLVAQAPITSIVFYSNELKRYFTVTWHPTKEVPWGEYFYMIELENNDIYMCDGEKTMINIFCQLIKNLNVDVITGWYSHGYDVPYIMKRMQKLFGNYNMISPVGNAWLGNKRPQDDYYKLKISGLDSVDLMEVVKSLNYNLQNNKLDTAAELILGTLFMKIKLTTWKDWEPNFDGFLKYALRDVLILHMIDDKLKCFEYLIQMQILSGITVLNDIMSVTKLIDSLIIKKFWNRVIFPNNTQKEQQSFMGGRTIDPRLSGVHRNVAVLDYASLYPTTIMGYNISPDTFLFSLQQLGLQSFNELLKNLQDNNIKYVDTGQSDELFGERYIFLSQEEHVGIIPELSLLLYLMRKLYKKLAATTKDPDLRLIADKRQYAIKIILNSIYGAMGFRFFRLFVPECADAVTYFARKAIIKALNEVSTYGTVLYSDTDSVDESTKIRYRLVDNSKPSEYIVYEKTIELLYHDHVNLLVEKDDNKFIGYLPDNMMLLYYDELSCQVKWGNALFIYRHDATKPMVRLLFANGKYITVTEDHSLMVKREGKLVECKAALLDGDIFYTLDGWTTCELIINIMSEPRRVYDIQMKDNPHTFFGNGVLVHNSLFVRAPHGYLDIEGWLEDFNKNGILELIRETNQYMPLEYYQYNLLHEKDLDYLYLGDRKKRYYAIERNGNKYIHGLNIIRKDTPKLIKTMLDLLCLKAVKLDISIEDLKLTFQQLKEANYLDVAVHKSFSKKFEQYTKTIPQHVAGALFANKHLDLKIMHSDVVFLFYINSFCLPLIKLKDRKNVVCLRTLDFDLIKTTDKFLIDYMLLFEKQILLPLRLFDKILLVSNAINEWCKAYPLNYRTDKHGEYIFKKKDVSTTK